MLLLLISSHIFIPNILCNYLLCLFSFICLRVSFTIEIITQFTNLNSAKNCYDTVLVIYFLPLASWNLLFALFSLSKCAERQKKIYFYVVVVVGDRVGWKHLHHFAFLLKSNISSLFSVFFSTFFSVFAMFLSKGINFKNAKIFFFLVQFT